MCVQPFLQEIQEAMLTSLANNAFMSLFDVATLESQKTELLLSISEAFMKPYLAWQQKLKKFEDDIEKGEKDEEAQEVIAKDEEAEAVEQDADILPGAQDGAAKLKDVFGALVVLLNPLPKAFGLDLALVSNLINPDDAVKTKDKDKGKGNSFAKAVGLCLQGAAWEKRVDEVLKTAAPTMKHADAVCSLTEALQNETGTDVSDTLRQAMRQLKDFKRQLRQGATDLLEKAVANRVK